MAAISTIIAGIAAAAALSQAGKSIYDSGQKKSSGAAPTPLPAGPAPDKTTAELAGMRGGAEPAAPGFLQFSSSMTPLQKRAALATFGSDRGGAYTSPESLKYYKELLPYSLYDESGKSTGSLLPVEKNFIENTLGRKPQGSTDESFLSALMNS